MVLPVVEEAASPYGLSELMLMLDHYIETPHRLETSTEWILHRVYYDGVAVVLLLPLATRQGCVVRGVLK